MGIKRTILVGILGSGILVGGIAFTGDQGLTNIQGNIESLKNKVVQSEDNVNFMKGAYNNLKGIFDNTVTSASSKVAELNGTIDNLQLQIEALDQGIVDTEGGRVELQAEIDRLEGEITRANTLIAELETFASTTDTETIVSDVIVEDFTPVAPSVEWYTEAPIVEGDGIEVPEVVETVPEVVAPIEYLAYSQNAIDRYDTDAVMYLAHPDTVTKVNEELQKMTPNIEVSSIEQIKLNYNTYALGYKVKTIEGTTGNFDAIGTKTFSTTLKNEMFSNMNTNTNIVVFQGIDIPEGARITLNR